MTSIDRGLFITVEGGEGSGKTTLVKSLKKHTEAKTTQEPFNKGIAHLLLKGKSWQQYNPTLFEEFCFFLSDRYCHMQSFIIPALDMGYDVICDCFIDSTLAYQGMNLDLDIDLVNQFVLKSADFLIPDMTIFLDIEPCYGLERSFKSEKNKIPISSKGIDFHNLVYKNFMQIIEGERERFLILDSLNYSKEEILEHSLNAINKLKDNY